mgnify:CR=1 FL=1
MNQAAHAEVPAKRPVAIIHDPACVRHDPGPGHPESPARYGAVMGALTDAGLLWDTVTLPGRSAARDDLLAVHEAAYLDLAEREIAEGAPSLSTGDTDVCLASWETALWAAGSAMAGVDAVMERQAGSVFCVLRPPGHHATPSRGMGFCLLNNAAIAARHAQRRHGLARVLIVDWDVHHGNGTQDAFYRDGSVFYFSSHQSPLYPGTGHPQERGAGPGLGTTLNWPLRAGAGRAEIMAAFEQGLLPAAEAFRPDLVIVSAGFDARQGDPLGGLRLTDEDFHDLTLLVQGIADRHAGGRLVSVLEGGYQLLGLGTAVVAHVRALVTAPAAP